MSEEEPLSALPPEVVAYSEALESYGRAKARLEECLDAMHRIGRFPSPPPSIRFRLPEERPALTYRADLGAGLRNSYTFYATPGLYSDGKVGELFVTAEKEGSLVSGLLSAVAIVISIALQYGVPLERIISKLRFTRYAPYGRTNHPKIPRATSIIDYLVRWMAFRFEPSIMDGCEVPEEDPNE